MVHGCHTDKVYLQPIKEIKFLDDWKKQYENMTEGNFIISIRKFNEYENNFLLINSLIYNHFDEFYNKKLTSRPFHRQMIRTMLKE